MNTLDLQYTLLYFNLEAIFINLLFNSKLIVYIFLIFVINFGIIFIELLLININIHSIYQYLYLKRIILVAYLIFNNMLSVYEYLWEENHIDKISAENPKSVDCIYGNGHYGSNRPDN